MDKKLFFLAAITDRRSLLCWVREQLVSVRVYLRKNKKDNCYYIQLYSHDCAFLQSFLKFQIYV